MGRTQGPKAPANASSETFGFGRSGEVQVRTPQGLDRGKNRGQIRPFKSTVPRKARRSQWHWIPFRGLFVCLKSAMIMSCIRRITNLPKMASTHGEKHILGFAGLRSAPHHSPSFDPACGLAFPIVLQLGFSEDATTRGESRKSTLSIEFSVIPLHQVKVSSPLF